VFGLTPARFDLLFALKEPHENGFSVLQSELRAKLGVSRPTVSRMLASLERLGFVRRDERAYTRRVYLTRLGRYVVRRAAKRVYHSGFAFREVRRAIRLGPPLLDFMARADLESLLNKMRRTFRDSATLYYRWHPDD